MNKQTEALKMASEWQEKTSELFEKYFDGDEIAKKAMYIPQNNYDEIFEFHREWKKWNVELFTPNGLKILGLL